MTEIIYVIIVLFATAMGAIAGIGGGVIIKPVYDAFGEYSASEISVLSSCAVFAMAAVSLIISSKQLKEERERLKTIIPLALGSVIGGLLGESVFSKLTAEDSVVKIIQNVLLLIIIVFVVIYMKRNDKKSFNSNKWYTAVLTGLILGAVSTFLGIGGGPINVAIITLVFGLEIKSAVLGSISVILFAQGTKLCFVAIKDISSFNIKSLPFIVIAGVCGALIGRAINKKLSEKAVNNCFIAVQIIIIGLCLFNIIRYSVL